VVPRFPACHFVFGRDMLSGLSFFFSARHQTTWLYYAARLAIRRGAGLRCEQNPPDYQKVAAGPYAGRLNCLGSVAMICHHLRDLERALQAAGIRETYRGTPWSRNCREWVYFDCRLDMAAIRHAFGLAECVSEHVNDDPKSGREAGLVCQSCHDAIIGVHVLDQAERPVFPVHRGDPPPASSLEP
jgi:hypothetical protein